MKKKHRKRRSFWINVTFLIVIIVLTVSAISLMTLTTKGKAALLPKNKQAVTPAPVVVDTTGSDFPGIKIITETSNDLYTPYTIQYPQIFHSPFNKAISSYIEDAKQGYLIEHTDENAITKAPIKEGNTAPSLNQDDSNGDADKDEGINEAHDSDIKKVALTFDDGPHPKVTMQILETLKKYDAKATFFMLGSMVEKYPETAKKVQEAGHELGNHTWNHLDLTKLSAEKTRNEISKTTAIIEDVTGQKVTEFRPPYGAVNETVRSQTILPVILWNVDTLDWKDRDSNQILANVKSATRDGSTILMHDIHQSTADGLDAVLAYLQSKSYTFVKVSDLK